jgi:RNA polymerase sigma factor (TIGR02999 family)
VEEHEDITQLLVDAGAGDREAAAELMPLVYERMRALAGHVFRGQPAAHTLQPTALVHEAFVCLVDRDRVQWRDRRHFIAVCAVAMRGILADHARRKRAAKRGGDGWQRVTLSETPSGRGAEFDLIALDDALTALAERSERQAKIIELRFFGGLTMPEIAEELDVSLSTVEADWRMARAWLSAELSDRAEREEAPS